MLSGEISVLPRNEMLSSGRRPDRTWPSEEPWFSFNNLNGARVENSPERESNVLRLAVSQDFEKMLVNSMANYFTQHGVPMTSRVDFVNSLLAPSNAAFLYISSQEWSFASAEQLLRLQARITHRQSILMRLKGDIKGSLSYSYRA